MNIRKPTNYSAMYAVLDRLMVEELPQVELYFEIGRAVCARTEKGAAVAASEYLQAAYPETIGFSPRNLRRMREFFRIYENVPELRRLAMKISWTQKVVSRVMRKFDLALAEIYFRGRVHAPWLPSSGQGAKGQGRRYAARLALDAL